MKKSFLRKILNVISALAIVSQSLTPYLVLLPQSTYAQEVTPAPTPEITPSPTPDATVDQSTPPTDTTSSTSSEPSATPSDTVTPTPASNAADATPTPTEDPAIATPTPVDNLSPPDSSQTPTDTSAQVQGESITPTPASNAADATPTPTQVPENPKDEQLSLIILDNVSAPSIDLEAVESQGSAVLTTDKPDYAPTDTALITGSNLLPNTTYILTISSDDPPAVSTTVEVTSDANGIFAYAYQLDGTYRPNYSAELRDSAGNVVATVTFTDSLTCQNDVNGANDLSGQKDLTRMCGDYASLPTTLSVTWNWDDIAWTGSNTGDGCALFDTDGNGKANNALCVTIGGTPATYQSKTLYACNDTKSDRCGSPNSTLSTSASTTCTAPVQSSDPFSAGDSYPNDTVANCSILMSDISASNATLVDVCSYPSSVPNSDPSDCIIATSASTGKLEIVKSLSPSSDPGLFNLQIDGSTLVSDVGNTGTTGSQVVLASAGSGTAHTFGETAGTGTSLSNYTPSVSCVLRGTATSVSTTGTNPWSINVVKDKDIVCTITNTRINNGSITIIKDAVPNDAQDFAFTTTGAGLSSFSLDDDLDGTLPNTTTFSNLGSGTYSVSEDAVPGWTQTSATCTDESPVSAIALAAGENVTCTFTNTKQATIIVQKNTTGGDGTFGFTSTGNNGLPANFDVSTTTGSGSQTYTVTPGVAYSVSETVPSGWSLTSSSCTSGTPSSFTPTAGETVTCTFNNNKKGHLIVQKTTVPAGDQTIFTINATGSGTITNGGAGIVTDSTDKDYEVTPGNYWVSETVPAGWSKTGNTCQNVAVAAGQTVYCLLINTKLGSITVVKNTNFGDGTFPFSTTGGLDPVNFNITTSGGTGSKLYSNVLPGSYSVTENTPANWVQGTISCLDGTDPIGNVNNSTASFSLAAGHSIVCTFNNTGQGQLKIVKNTVGGNDTFGFTVNGPTPLTPNILTSGGTGNTGFSTVTAGNYSVSETTIPANWTLTGTSCTNGQASLDPTDFDINPGDSVTCTFENTRDTGTIIVKKVMVGGTSTFDFTGSPSGSISVSNGTLQETVNTGTYTSTEAVKAGWSLTNISCNDGTSNVPSTVDLNTRTATFNVESHETVTCTFTNNKPAAQIDLTPLTATNKIGEDHEITANVQVQNGDGSWESASDGTLVTFSITNTNGATATFVGGIDTCTTTSGTCSVTINSPTVGHVEVNASSSPVLLGVTLPVSTGTGGNNSADAQKDYVNARISITPNSSTNEVNDDHNFTVTVEQNTGLGWGPVSAGTLANAIVNTSAGIDASDCNNGVNASGQCTVTVNSGIAGVFTITARSTVNINGVEFKLQTNGQGENSAAAQKTYVDASIELSPQQATNDVNDPHTIVAHVTKNDGSGVTNAEDVTVTFTVTSGTATFVGNDNDCVTDASGECSVQIVDDTPGANTIDATTTFSVGGVSLTRSTDANGNPGPDGTDSAEKTYVGGKIIVQKVTVGGDDSFNFNTNYSSDFQLSNGQSNDSGYLPTGTYSVSEDGLAGWDSDGGVCDNQQSPDNIVLGADETITCTFTNTKRGHIIVDKITDPSQDPQSFTFTTTGTGYIGFSLTDQAIPNDQELVPGTYSVAETLPSGWTQTSAVCDNQQTPENINLQAGQTVNCTFTNTKYATVIVTKYLDDNANGQNDNEQVLDGWDINLNNTDYNDDYDQTKPTSNTTGRVTFDDLLPGDYTLNEVLENQPDWNLSNISCTGDKGIDTTNEHLVTVNAGDVINCSIGNYRNSTIIVSKVLYQPDGLTVTSNDDTTFDFNITDHNQYNEEFSLSNGDSTSYEVTPGNYDVSELTPNSDYEFVDCTAQYENQSVGTPITGGENVTVNSGDTVNVTCYNKQKPGTITGTKWSDLNENGIRDCELFNLDGEFDGQFCETYTDPGLQNWHIQLFVNNDGSIGNKVGEDQITGSDGSYTFPNVAPGNYFVCEVEQTGWNQTYPNLDQEISNCWEITVASNGNYSNKDFGNHNLTPILTISKTNNAVGDKAPGDIVGFTITIAADSEGGPADNVKVVDLLPKGFVFNSASWKVVSSDTTRGVSGDITSLLTAPTYASPGIWSLGHLNSGETLTLTYTATIDGSQQTGTYYDNAWGQGTPVGSSTIIFARAINPGDLDPAVDPSEFVGTQVSVINPSQPGVDYKATSTKEVLGASTFLPATGEPTVWVIIATILSGLGLGFLFLGIRLRRKYEE